jgi:hypothetical protein
MIGTHLAWQGSEAAVTRLGGVFKKRIAKAMGFLSNPKDWHGITRARAWNQPPQATDGVLPLRKALKVSSKSTLFLAKRKKREYTIKSIMNSRSTL